MDRIHTTIVSLCVLKGCSVISDCEGWVTASAQQISQDVFSVLSHQGQFPAISHILLQFVLGMGLLGILQHNAHNSELPHTELKRGFPLLAAKQHCRSLLGL